MGKIGLFLIKEEKKIYAIPVVICDFENEDIKSKVNMEQADYIISVTDDERVANDILRLLIDRERQIGIVRPVSSSQTSFFYEQIPSNLLRSIYPDIFIEKFNGTRLGSLASYHLYWKRNKKMLVLGANKTIYYLIQYLLSKEGIIKHVNMAGRKWVDKNHFVIMAEKKDFENVALISSQREPLLYYWVDGWYYEGKWRTFAIPVISLSPTRGFILREQLATFNPDVVIAATSNHEETVETVHKLMELRRNNPALCFDLIVMTSDVETKTIVKGMVKEAEGIYNMTILKTPFDIMDIQSDAAEFIKSIYGKSIRYKLEKRDRGNRIVKVMCCKDKPGILAMLFRRIFLHPTNDASFLKVERYSHNSKAINFENVWQHIDHSTTKERKAKFFATGKFVDSNKVFVGNQMDILFSLRENNDPEAINKINEIIWPTFSIINAKENGKITMGRRDCPMYIYGNCIASRPIQSTAESLIIYAEIKDEIGSLFYLFHLLAKLKFSIPESWDFNKSNNFHSYSTGYLRSYTCQARPPRAYTEACLIRATSEEKEKLIKEVSKLRSEDLEKYFSSTLCKLRLYVNDKKTARHLVDFSKYLEKRLVEHKIKKEPILFFEIKGINNSKEYYEMIRKKFVGNMGEYKVIRTSKKNRFAVLTNSLYEDDKGISRWYKRTKNLLNKLHDEICKEKRYEGIIAYSNILYRGIECESKY
ncbi:MAG TPA: hypothetical protein ENI33_04265 [Thermoplasmatales archaeon]|nr:hypothetical protein [Thermoplasmatales archaeon]